VNQVPTISADHSAAIGPGRLILVVGPSGAGKDTLLGLAKAVCADDRNIRFPRRVVTREASQAEDNDELSTEAFRLVLAQGGFAVHWEAHGHHYGLPRSIENDVRSGRTVVVNVSRTVVGALRRAYAEVVVVLITAPPEVLAERLAARRRSSDGKIEQRIGRIVDEPALPDVAIVNVGDAEEHAHRLVRIIRGT
jgi:ribose 1,5-bisphosphokinase